MTNEWYIERKVIIKEQSGQAYLARHNYQFFLEDYVNGEFEMFVLDSNILTSVVADLDFAAHGCKGFGRMVKEVFPDWEWMDMLKYPSRKTGILTSAQRIYWVENIHFNHIFLVEHLIRSLIYQIEESIYNQSAVLIFGFYPGVLNLFPILKELNFRDIHHLDQRFANRPNPPWNVRYEMFLSE